MKPFSRQGFTLIELSIVLVIIGLLVGGIFVGKDLIQASKNRNLISDLDRYTKAAGLFQEKYYALPGDDARINTMFTVESCPYLSGVLTGSTCNGNGNGRIGFDSSGNYGSAATSDSQTAYTEMVMFWQHLGMTGLIENGYQFCGSNNGDCPRTAGLYAGKTSASSLSFSMGWMARPLGGAACTYYSSLCTGGHWFYVAGTNRTNPSPWQNRATVSTKDIAPKDALSIDQKIDDGLPGSGTMISVGTWNGSNPGVGCTTSASAASALYDVSSTGTGCQMFFKTAF